ncbi:hypothetical protein GCM10010129_76220 [Streptomyces fumigatiscleroticus]|nr:hypothetical protein GCM10010129_76220 [Streptomyces fumigatiscleroticus]
MTLTVVGVVTLTRPHRAAPHQAASTPRPKAVITTALPASGRPTPDATRQHTQAAGSPAPSAARESPLPPHGEGPAGDAAIQQVLDTAWPADLAPGDERQLLAAGRALLRADATGIGRARWPGLFPGAGSGRSVTPAFATARLRIQAAIARRDGTDGAVVHLVWAGTDRGGTYTDNRITDWHFTRNTSRKGASTWTPQPQL